MEYVKPTICLAGTAHAMVLGSILGDGDSPQSTTAKTRPVLLGLGLDD